MDIRIKISGKTHQERLQNLKKISGRYINNRQKRKKLFEELKEPYDRYIYLYYIEFEGADSMSKNELFFNYKLKNKMGKITSEDYEDIFYYIIPEYLLFDVGKHDDKFWCDLIYYFKGMKFTYQEMWNNCTHSINNNFIEKMKKYDRNIIRNKKLEKINNNEKTKTKN